MKGFTLLEIMVVVVIVGLLATVAITQFSNRGEQAKYDLTKAQLHDLVRAIKMYKLDCSKLPEKLDDLLTRPSGLETKWKGPYVEEGFDFKDKWGNEYIYKPSSDGTRFDLVSYGADGKEGGTDLAEDIIYPEKRK
jgi:general secretion pathway protein G